MTEIGGQPAKLELLASDIYRVNPMDRDAGGHADEPFRRFMKREEKEGEERKEGAEPGSSAPRRADPPRDDLLLSESAKAMLQAGPPGATPAATPAASATSAPAPGPEKAGPLDENRKNEPPPPPGSLINIVA